MICEGRKYRICYPPSIQDTMVLCPPDFKNGAGIFTHQRKCGSVSLPDRSYKLSKHLGLYKNTFWKDTKRSESMTKISYFGPIQKSVVQRYSKSGKFRAPQQTFSVWIQNVRNAFVLHENLYLPEEFLYIGPIENLHIRYLPLWLSSPDTYTIVWYPFIPSLLCSATSLIPRCLQRGLSFLLTPFSFSGIRDVIWPLQAGSIR